ncbi:glycosyltransferase [Larkinella harenae]
MNKPRILFATLPLDGHFNPLTGLAVHLANLGYDVRWYVGGRYGNKVKQLGLPHYDFVSAQVVNQENLEELFPERKKIKGTIARLRFDINQVFLLRIPEFIRDLSEIRQEWPFELMVSDVAFFAAPFVQELWGVKTITGGIAPLGESDANLPPAGMGMEPSDGFWGLRKQDFLRFLTQKILFKPCNDLYNRLRLQHGLQPTKEFVFDNIIHSADLYLQSGVPGFEYQRRKVSPTIRFVGPMLPHPSGHKHDFVHRERLKQYSKVILATQGTVERDPEKLLVPTLEAFKESDYLVVVTTGGSQTAELRARYPHPNIIIEDFIDFDQIMPQADVYVTNAGYGGVMLSISNGLPMVVAGVHEGKSEIAARVGYFKLGVNLKTETPTTEQIRQSVENVLANSSYKRNVERLGEEFGQYNANQLAAQYVHQLLVEGKVRTKDPVLMASASPSMS